MRGAGGEERGGSIKVRKDKIESSKKRKKTNNYCFVIVILLATSIENKTYLERETEKARERGKMTETDTRKKIDCFWLLFFFFLRNQQKTA